MILMIQIFLYICPTVVAILQAAVQSRQELNETTIAPFLNEVTHKPRSLSSQNSHS